MAAKQIDTGWMWHPQFTEERTDTAGLFVHFRKTILVETLPASPVKIHITADTRYKLYVNNQEVANGPVKGDRHLWFYDELDLTPFLTTGANKIGVQVLRFFYATPYATSFPRLPVGGLMIKPTRCDEFWTKQLQSSCSWETAIDQSTLLPIDQAEDDFLHIYEHRTAERKGLKWMEAKLHEFQASTGLGAPWKLSLRMIPQLRFQVSSIYALHNIKSQLSTPAWEDKLLQKTHGSNAGAKPLRLPAHTTHSIEIEVENHTTGKLRFCFQRPASGGSMLAVTYSESYENRPLLTPYLRSKEDRRDDTKFLFGPQDIYRFTGVGDGSVLGYGVDEETEEVFAPFHFRTFRFLAVQIDVGDADLLFDGIEITTTKYPLDVSANLSMEGCDDQNTMEKLWTTSIRTLENCMHDHYEDCPFYEQLQYAMDMRSSALFTYYASGDDRLTRQAIIQFRNSFEPHLGLTSSRAPSHQPQTIPHFSLFWICVLSDHLNFFGDVGFLRQFVPIIDAILAYFDDRIDGDLQLVSAKSANGVWNFTDWTEEWRPYGIPPAAERTGFSTYTNCLYVYTLQNAATILLAIDRPSLADEYLTRARRIISALRLHCFDGKFFTDGLAKAANPEDDYSVHSQVWAILSGAVTGPNAQEILRSSLNQTSEMKFTQPSVSMSFYTFRALSAVGGEEYNHHFATSWEPWCKQLVLNLTTWEEDSVSQRSDCHAWGSSPVYEFMAEVAGGKPSRAGWEAILFQPRLSLFAAFKARIPIRGRAGEFAHVQWTTRKNGEVDASLRLETTKKLGERVYVCLPGQALSVFDGMKEMRFVMGVDKDRTPIAAL
ncbi:glycoside hydrolase family 78 protein [Cadophora sp. DSE1049]|nr:glycoside hydrolase family 78 protein [Cadophora sp. DSE1049]